MKRKKLFCSVILLYILLSACSNNHYHDGIYKAEIINPDSVVDNHYEMLTVDGNKLLTEKYTLKGNAEEKLSYKCIQYPDRIEYDNGAAMEILTVADSGNLKVADNIVFKRFGRIKDGYTITKQSMIVQ